MATDEYQRRSANCEKEDILPKHIMMISFDRRYQIYGNLKVILLRLFIHLLKLSNVNKDQIAKIVNFKIMTKKGEWAFHICTRKTCYT